MLNICQENFWTSAGVSEKEIGGQQREEIHYTNRKSFTKMILIMQQKILNISIKSKQNKTKSIIIASGLKLKIYLRILGKLLFSWIGGFNIRNTLQNRFNVIQNEIQTFKT